MLASHSPEICNSWDWLPEGILREITVRLDLCSVKATRLVCARWRIVVDRSVEHLRLSKAKIHNVIAQFPAVKHIDMSGALPCRALHGSWWWTLTQVSCLVGRAAPPCMAPAGCQACWLSPWTEMHRQRHRHRHRQPCW